MELLEWMRTSLEERNRLIETLIEDVEISKAKLARMEEIKKLKDELEIENLKAKIRLTKKETNEHR